MNFYINDDYLTDVTVREEYVPRIDTPDQLIEAIKYAGRTYAIKTIDHPEFAELRNCLEQQGYIVTERNWWNGDRVLQPFVLNGVQFDKNEQFPCAVAMKGHLQFARKYQRRKHETSN
jgi:hypothetical protein